MKIFSKISLVLAVGVMLLGTSCVSSKKYDALAAEKDALAEKCRTDKDELKAQINDLESSNSKLKTEVSNANRELENTGRKLTDAEAAAEAARAKIENIKMQIKEAMAAATENDLEVENKDVKLYVSLANSILYTPGSANVSKDGKEIIAQLAEVFKENSDMDILVVGHTDSKPIRRSRYLYNDNWDLSCERASNVVKELIKGGVDGSTLTAAGRADMDMVDMEMEGKDAGAASRRIEFILTPSIEAFNKL